MHGLDGVLGGAGYAPDEAVLGDGSLGPKGTPEYDDCQDVDDGQGDGDGRGAVAQGDRVHGLQQTARRGGRSSAGRSPRAWRVLTLQQAQVRVVGLEDTQTSILGAAKTKRRSQWHNVWGVFAELRTSGSEVRLVTNILKWQINILRTVPINCITLPNTYGSPPCALLKPRSH